MKRLIFWGTIAAGVTAAYMMTRRGAPLSEVLSKSLRNPIGTLGTELKGAFAQQKQPSLTA